MRLIIAGSRDLTARQVIPYITQYIKTLSAEDIRGLEIVNGGCPTGVDAIAEDYFKESKVTLFDADWEKYGKSAGPRRNKLMAEYADELLLIWDGKSRGSANMKREMLQLGKPVTEVVVIVEPKPQPRIRAGIVAQGVEEV